MTTFGISQEPIVEISEFLIDENKNFIDDKCIMVVTRLSDNY